MRHALLALSVAVLAGCGSIANTVFDSEEAARYVNLMVTTERAIPHCAETEFMASTTFLILEDAQAAEAYSRVKFNNPRVAEAGKILLDQAIELNTRYEKTKPSTAYCQLKLGQIAAAAEVVARSIGKKELVSPIAIQ